MRLQWHLFLGLCITVHIVEMTGGIEIDLVEGEGVITRGGQDGTDVLEVNRNVGEVTLACRFTTPQSTPPTFMANGKDYAMTETVVGLEWTVTVDLDKEDTYVCSSPDESAQLIIDMSVDVYLEVSQGKGTLTRDEDGNYNLKVFPGETLALFCAPEYVLDVYEWKREPSTVLYSSASGVQISESDPDIDRLKFEPRLPSRWDQAWQMRIGDLVSDETFSFSCSSAMYGQTTVDISVGIDAIESVDMTFNGEGELSADKGTVTIDFDECNTDPTKGLWFGLGDYCYHVGTNDVTYDDAEARCRALDSELTSIHSGDEQQFHEDLMESPRTGVSNAWIGLNDRDDDRTYTYTDNSPVDFTDWGSLEPDWKGRHPCVHISLPEFNDWIDARCTDKYGYICKRARGSGDKISFGSTTITCAVYGEEPAGSVRWYKNDEELMQPDYSMRETESGRQYELTLTKGLANGGNYRCVADDGREGALNVNLTVNTKISDTDAWPGKFRRGADGEINRMDAAKGQNITLMCTSTFTPMEPVFKWQMSPLVENKFTEISPESLDEDHPYFGRLTFSQDLEKNSWSLTLVNVSEEDSAVYSCETHSGSSGVVIGKDTVYVTVYEAAEAGLDISLTTLTDGATTRMSPDQPTLSVSRSVGIITLTCRTSFWADTIVWRDDHGRDTSIFGPVNVDSVPGWEKTSTFEFEGRILSDGDYTCDASDSTSGISMQRTFLVVTTATVNIDLTEGRGQYIETPEKNIITAFKGETISVTCTMKYLDDYFDYLRWNAGDETYYSPNYRVYSNDPLYGRVSFTKDADLGQSTMTLTDVSIDDEMAISCHISDFDPDIVHLVVSDEMTPCDFECYPGTGSWDGNCVTPDEICNGVAYCDNLQDEADCSALGCQGLTSPTNGRMTATSFAFGSIVSFHCKPSYVLEGSESRQCQDDGQWTGDQPVCTLDVFHGCPRLTSPENGYIFDLGNDVGDNNYFQCQRGYVLQGDSSRTCQESGNWTGEPVTCQITGNTLAKQIVRLARGNGEVVHHLRDLGGSYVPYYRTVITVDKNAGSISIACRFPSASSPPYWYPTNMGRYTDVTPLIGEHSISETLEGLEWTLTMGITEDGPLQAGSQTQLECDTSYPVGYEGKFRIDVLGDQPFADLSTTKVAITVSEGEKIEEIIEQPDGSFISNIQVNPGSKVSITCNVTTDGAIPSEYMTAIWDKEGEWGDGSYTSSYYSPISQGDYLHLYDDNVSLKEDREKLDWTLTFDGITEKFNVVLKCSVIPDATIMFRDEVVVARANIKVELIPDYRADYKCGPNYLAPTGLEAACPGECCSTDGMCGSSDEHCITNLYKDYRDPCNYGNSEPSNNIDWQTTDDDCYVLIKKKISFDDAANKCQEFGARLSSIHNDAEQELHTSMMSELSAKRAWIGLNDMKKEGKFVNIDHSPVDFTFWANREPNNAGGDEDCTHLKLADDGRWKDVPCSDTMSYFCKKAKKVIAERPTVQPTTNMPTSQPTTAPTTPLTDIQPDIGSDVTIALTSADLPYDVQEQTLPGFGTVSTIQVIEGDSITLTCKASAEPSDTISWIRENAPLSVNEMLLTTQEKLSLMVGSTEEANKQGWALTISDVSKSEEGQWICAKSGTAGLSTALVILEVSDGTMATGQPSPSEDVTIELSLAALPFEEEDTTIPGIGTLKTIQITEGDTIALTCKIATKEPSESIVWTHENLPISFNGVMVSTRENIQINEDQSKLEWTVTISDVSASEGGQWICAKSGGVGLSAAVANLIISDVTLATTQPSPGEDGTMTTNQPSPSEDVSIELTLAELPFEVEDTTIPGIGTLKTIRITLGDTIALTCKIATKEPSESIVWTHENLAISFDGIMVSTRKNIQISEDLSKMEWTVTISDVSASEGGQWMCAKPAVVGLSAAVVNLIISDVSLATSEPSPGEDGTMATNQPSPIEDVVILLTLAELPFEVEELTIPGIGTFKNIQITEGDTIALTCKISSREPSESIVWTHEDSPISYDGVVLSSQENIQMSQDLNKMEWTVTISNVSPSEEGQWICAKSGGVGISAAVVNLTISDGTLATSEPSPGEDTPSTTTIQPSTEKDRVCEELSDESVNLCPDLTYDVTTMPNSYGHVTQAAATKALSVLLETITGSLCVQEILCALHFPPCKDLNGAFVPILPCASVCLDGYICNPESWPPVPELDCNNFPTNDASYSRCWEPNNSIFGDNRPCERVPSEFCRNLGFRHTKFPNALKHENTEEAMTAFQHESIQKLIDDGCSAELASFACAAFFPPCDDNVVTQPCYEVCRRTWKSCKSAATNHGVEKNDIFACGKRYPSNDEGQTCLIDLTPPSSTPRPTGSVHRLFSSIEFTVDTDDTNVDGFHATAYAINIPESLPVSSTYVPVGTSSSNIALGSSESSTGKMTSPLDPDTSYFVVIQAENQYGLSPMRVLAVPRYNEDNTEIPSDGFDLSLISETGLTHFTPPNNHKQALCVNLKGEDEPGWRDENDNYIDDLTTSSSTGVDVKATVLPVWYSGIGKMTLLEVFSEAVGGPYECVENMGSTSDGVVVAAFNATCFESEHLFCKDYSKDTFLPNVFGHLDAQTAELASYEFIHLLQSLCVLNSEELMKFVCEAYAPSGSCDTSGLSVPRLPPCKEVCVKVREDSKECMDEINFVWPRIASCDRFPSVTGGMCSDLGVDLGTFTDVPTSNETAQDECDIKPRRYDVTSLGKGCYFRGWVDVQGQGASNDYCRVVSTGGQMFLACALAGTAGESEYNYNSTNASEVWFDIGHVDTWYMKDEDGDGKDDYCRCVGKRPDTYVSCMKAGDTGFIGFYDFTPSHSKTYCHNTKVNPFFGIPVNPGC